MNQIDITALKGEDQSYTEAFKKAFEICRKQGGGTVHVPPGKYISGPIEMCSNSTLHLDAGAEILFTTNRDGFPLVAGRWEGKVMDCYMPLIYGKGLENVSVCGRGVLNGQGAGWWKPFKAGELDHPRPRFISFEDSERILIEGIKLVDSPSWTVTPVNSRNITIHNISIRNPADSPNTDGINPDSCSEVRISDCHVDVGDDCITIKSGVEQNPDRIPCQNISITNCTLVRGHGGVVIGSEMSGSVRNVVISNCIFNGTDRGVRLKSRRGRGGVVEDIRISNLIMDDVMCPVVMNLYYFCGEGGKDKKVWDPAAYPVDEGTPAFRRISINGLTARNARSAAMFLNGLPESPLKELNFSDLRIHMASGAEPEYPAMRDKLEPMTGEGVIVEYVEDSSFRDVTVENCSGEVFTMNHVSGIRGEVSAAADSSIPG
ncbi:MAG: glycoside hydrolase family 28 protein [Spirochaetales bacterium]|nr:glycoside hydrolase family 28 protein [Spirochaetales bacterium]